MLVYQGHRIVSASWRTLSSHLQLPVPVLTGLFFYWAACSMSSLHAGDSDIYLQTLK